MLSTEQAIGRMYQIKATIKQLEAEYNELKDDLDLPEDSYAIGDYLVDVKATRRFNAGLAKEVLNAEEYATICVPTPQSSRAKALFPDAYDLMQKVSGVTVNIKIDEED